jgi:hypothetical protein
MKVFRNIRLYGSSVQIEALRQKLEELPPTSAWRPSAPPRNTPDALVFEYTGVEAPSAFVFLFDEPSCGARVTNIVPESTSSLSYDEYNTIAVSFARNVLDPLATPLAVRVDLGPSEQSVEDLLPAAAAAALRRFSRSANRATGTAHPQDAEKWDQFVILAHREHASLAPSNLRRWLVEDERWNDDQAYDLSLKYESALRLLTSNDRFKAA